MRADQRGEVDRQRPRGRASRERAVDRRPRATGCRRPASTADERQQPGLARAGAAGSGARARGERGHGTDRARACPPSSPRPLETEPDLADLDLVAEGQRRDAVDRLPLTYEPFVLPRSSTYQPRPRNVRTACSADANGSSMTIALLTSRPSVVMASSAKDVPGRRLTARRGDDDEASESSAALAGRGAAGRAAAHGRPGTGTGRGARGTAIRTHPEDERGSRPSVRGLVDLDLERRVAQPDAGRRRPARPR